MIRALPVAGWLQLRQKQRSVVPPRKPRFTIRYRFVRIVVSVMTVTPGIVLVDFARVAVAVIVGISRPRGAFISVAPAVPVIPVRKF